MKKIYILIGLAFAIPYTASAASFVITPSSGSYASGDVVTLRISVDPAGSTIYTAMLDATFSPANLEVVSFALNDSMLALKQAGYDSIDTVRGTLVKTGGYTGGISSVTPFGTLVLRAKASGTGTFVAGDSSKLLDSNNTNKQAGSQSVSFAITDKVPSVNKVEAQKKAIAPQEVRVNAKVEENLKPSDDKATSTQIAAVAQSSTSASVMLWLLGAVAMIAMFAIGYVFGSRRLSK